MKNFKVKLKDGKIVRSEFCYELNAILESCGSFIRMQPIENQKESIELVACPDPFSDYEAVHMKPNQAFYNILNSYLQIALKDLNVIFSWNNSGTICFCFLEKESVFTD